MQFVQLLNDYNFTLFSQSYLNDPEVMGALSEIMQDQSKITKYLNNPKIMKAMAAMQGMMGGMGKGKGETYSRIGLLNC